MDYETWLQIHRPTEQSGIHLGDGVYLRYDGEHLILSANSPTTDTIYLDHHVRKALMQAIQQLDNLDTEQSA